MGIISDRQQKVKGGETFSHLSYAKTVENKSPAHTFLLLHYPVCPTPAWPERHSSPPNGIVNWRCQECKSTVHWVCTASSQSDPSNHCTWEMDNHMGEIEPQALEKHQQVNVVERIT